MIVYQCRSNVALYYHTISCFQIICRTLSLVGFLDLDAQIFYLHILLYTKIDNAMS